MQKKTTNWEPSVQKMTGSEGILKGDVTMFPSLKDGKNHRCQFHTLYQYVFKLLSRSNNIREQFKTPRRRRWRKRHFKLKRDHDPDLLWRYLLLSHLGLSKRPKLSSTECKTNFAIVKLISWRFRQFLDLPRISGIIGSLHDLITWSTFGKHENSSLLKNFVSRSWKSILKLGNLRIFSRISQK